MRVPRAPAPAGVEQFLEVAADAGAQCIHCGRCGERAIELFGGLGIDKPVEQRKLRPPGPREARALRSVAASTFVHAAGRKLTLAISSQVWVSSPTRSVTAPRPRIGPPSPACCQSVARPSRKASVSTAAALATGG